MLSQSEKPLALLAAARLIPLLTIERVEDAVPLAQALVDGGLATMEIALRTPAEPHALRARHRDADRTHAGDVEGLPRGEILSLRPVRRPGGLARHARAFPACPLLPDGRNQRGRSGRL